MNNLYIKKDLSIFAFTRRNRYVAFFLTAIYSISLLPLFRANINYRDDGGRVLWAFDGWNNFGRVTSNSLSHILHADQYLRDISPLTQIIAILIIVMASMSLLYVVRGNVSVCIWDALCVLPLGLFPYFLCCFSYKYDSPYMALSVLVSILPLIIRKKYKLYYPVAFICILLMCTTYQGSAGIFPMLVVYTAFIDWKNGSDNKESILYCLCSAMTYVFAMFIFFVFIPKGDSGYVTEKMSFNSLSIKHVFKNYLIYIQTFKDDFRIKWFIIIAILTICFIYRLSIETNKKKNRVIAASIVTYIFLFLFSFGPYPFLDEPFLMPRGMYGICTFITLICLGATTTLKSMKKHTFTKIISWVNIIVLSWMCIVFSCTYGNALFAQKNYDDYRIEEVAMKTADLHLLNESTPTVIQITGSIGYAAGIKNIPGDKILSRLMPPPFGGENYWSYLKFLFYYGLPQMNYSEDLEKTKNKNWAIADENCYHIIYSDGKDVIIELK